MIRWTLDGGLFAGALRREAEIPALTVEAEPVLSPERYALLAARYWVLRAWNGEVEPWAWCLSPLEPLPVPNRQMRWERPTYADAVAREERWRDDPEHFRRYVGEYHGRYQRYARAEPLPGEVREHGRRPSLYGNAYCVCGRTTWPCPEVSA